MVYIRISIRNPRTNNEIHGILAKVNTGALTLLSEKYALLRIPADIATKLNLNIEDSEEVEMMDFLRRPTKIRILREKILVKVDIPDRNTEYVESMVFIGPGAPLITYPLSARLNIEISPPRNAWKLQDEDRWRPSEKPTPRNNTLRIFGGYRTLDRWES